MAVEREDRRQLLALEAERHVGVVLKDREAVGAGQFEQPLALVDRERVAGWVLEVGNDVRQLRLRSGKQHALECRDVDPIRLELDHPYVGTPAAQRQQRTVIRWPLHDHRVASVHQRVEQKCVGLHRAVGDQHALGLDAMLLGDPPAQRQVADGRSVGGRTGRIVVERALRGGSQPLDVDDVQRWGTAGERDRLRHRARRLRAPVPERY